MINNNFAQLGEFIRETEKYELKAFFHLNPESIIAGKKGKLFVRPKLIFNNRTINFENAGKCNLEI